MCEGPGALPVAEALGSKVLGVTAFAVYLSILVGQRSRLQSLPTLGAAEAAILMP